MFNILVVDDDKKMNEIYCSVLSYNAFHPFPAFDGQQALDIVAENQIDLVISDIMMPGMDGTCTLEKIRDWEKQQGRMPMPVVLLTADNTVGARRRYLSFGFNDYLSKPIQPQQICDLVRVYLNV